MKIRQAGFRGCRVGALRQMIDLESVQVEGEGVEPAEPGGQARQHLIAVRRRQTPIANGLQPVVDEVAGGGRLELQLKVLLRRQVRRYRIVCYHIVIIGWCRPPSLTTRGTSQVLRTPP